MFAIIIFTVKRYDRVILCLWYVFLILLKQLKSHIIFLVVRVTLVQLFISNFSFVHVKVVLLFLTDTE